MSLREKVIKSTWARKRYYKILRISRNLAALGIFPPSRSKFFSISRYFLERSKFESKGGVISHFFPILSDYGDKAGNAKGHYFHQDLLVAQYIHNAAPQKHIDVGSRIDGFVAHVASFRKIEILDIRNMVDISHPNIEYRKADLMSDAGVEITDSLSCLHALEHFGLGRYGDPIHPDGYLLGWANLIRMLKPGGIIYISFQ